MVSVYTMSRGLGYTDVELQGLLAIIKEVLPRALMNGKLCHEITSKTFLDKRWIVLDVSSML